MPGRSANGHPNGETNLARCDGLAQGLLSNDGEILQWTQRIELNGGMLTFEGDGGAGGIG